MSCSHLHLGQHSEDESTSSKNKVDNVFLVEAVVLIPAAEVTFYLGKQRPLRSVSQGFLSGFKVSCPNMVNGLL
jgi:hypothetical protein